MHLYSGVISMCPGHASLNGSCVGPVNSYEGISPGGAYQILDRVRRAGDDVSANEQRDRDIMLRNGAGIS